MKENFKEQSFKEFFGESIISIYNNFKDGYTLEKTDWDKFNNLVERLQKYKFKTGKNFSASDARNYVYGAIYGLSAVNAYNESKNK